VAAIVAYDGLPEPGAIPAPSTASRIPTTMPFSTRAALRTGSGLILAAALAACSSPAGSSQQPASAAAGTPSPAASTGAPEASATSEATPAASVLVPSMGAGTPLVDLLPNELGGEATQKHAFVGDDLSALDGSTAMVFGSLQNVLGSDGSDMTIGAASNSRASIIAIRVTGKSAQEVGDAMIAGRTLNATTTKDELDLGGKHVVKVTTTIAPLPFYIYGTGDVSFTIAAADETIVAEALSKLP